ncbi:hypothetical protein LJC32_02655 [Oscillospiraceae bacterium OttesenSCG-928-F05]|nr:hypothetical protein [Oscillospiraceae bacterium OttesenSCG-928-F05]
MAKHTSFGTYMFSLLYGALKRRREGINQLQIFCHVMGRHFDALKQAAFRLRTESMIMSASDIMLPEHGKDRGMDRLPGETAEGYRTRLAMKATIAERAGTLPGVLDAVAALGYDQSAIEPFYVYDPERWAEFIIWLKGSEQSGVNDISIIDAEVRKVKEASAKPVYGAAFGSTIEIYPEQRAGLYGYPLCGTLNCGTYPGPDDGRIEWLGG